MYSLVSLLLRILFQASAVKYKLIGRQHGFLTAQFLSLFILEHFTRYVTWLMIKFGKLFLQVERTLNAVIMHF